MASLSGTVIPMPTPFDERGEVDEKERSELKTRLAEAGWPPAG